MSTDRALRTLVIVAELVSAVTIGTLVALLGLTALVIWFMAARGVMTWRAGWSMWWQRVRADLRRK